VLSDEELRVWLRKCDISQSAQGVINAIRNGEPSRKVNSRVGNVIVIYPSRKMGRTIQAESGKNEFPYVIQYEYDPDVLEYYDQPGIIKLNYLSREGKKRGVLHTPDFFVIRSNGAGWEECKKEQDMEKLAAKAPNRYVLEEDGSWRVPPGEEYAEPYGFYYRLRSSKEINWVLQRNVTFLEDYLRATYRNR
jgi:putative transposase